MRRAAVHRAAAEPAGPACPAEERGRGVRGAGGSPARGDPPARGRRSGGGRARRGCLMPRLSDSYSAIGPRSPVREAQVETAIYVLEDTARDLRADARQRARVAPDEGEGPEAQAQALDRAIAILRG